MFVKKLFSFKLIMLAGLALNIAITIYVYFMVDGGPVSLKPGGDWMAILNEIPMVVLFYLAGVFKPYLMIWSKCRKNPATISMASTVMLATTAIASWIIWLAATPITKDVTLYSNWALLWGASAYYVLIPQRTPSNE
jgi:multisubunit Na+/H+ antiporter MnhB subunit